jgi:prolyl-tRNA editing enzyme YbaK/EbsC (Cys-tRNA(Pro) deacylase)
MRQVSTPPAAVLGTLTCFAALSRPDLLAEPVTAALTASGLEAYVAAIDADLADTDNFCAHYGVPLAASANAVVVRGVRGETERFAVCMTLATRRLDVNGVVRKRLDARKASFAPLEETVSRTGMEYGGITPVGVPADWPVWVDGAVADQPWLCIGSGIRGSKLFVPAATLLGLPGAERVDGLARAIPHEAV